MPRRETGDAPEIAGFAKIRGGRRSLLEHLHDSLTGLPAGRVLVVEPPEGRLKTEPELVAALHRLLRMA